MTTEQAPGIPWHDHEWANVTRMGDTQQHFICCFDPVARVIDARIPGSPRRCPAEKFEPIPEPPKRCETCGQQVWA